MFTYLKPKTDKELMVGMNDPSISLYELSKLCAINSSVGNIAAEVILNRMNVPVTSTMKNAVKTGFTGIGIGRDLEILMHYVYPTDENK